MITLFKYGPDVLDLVISTSAIKELEIKQLSTPFGLDTRKFIVINDVILGQIIKVDEYYLIHGINIGNRVVVNLAPAMPDDSGITLPSAAQFEQQLSKLLQNAADWVLACEECCEQNPIKSLRYGTRGGEQALRAMFGFCNGGHNPCPTFFLKKA